MLILAPRFARSFAVASPMPEAPELAHFSSHVRQVNMPCVCPHFVLTSGDSDDFAFHNVRELTTANKSDVKRGVSAAI